MKRPSECSENTRVKKLRTSAAPYLFPSEMWGEIAMHLDIASIGALLSSASCCFFNNYEQVFLNSFRQNWLDFHNESELLELSGKLHKLEALQYLLPWLKQDLERVIKIVVPHEGSICDDAEDADNLVKFIDELFNACREGHVATLQMLIKQDLYHSNYVNFISEGMTPLGLAAASGRKRIFDLLLENQAKFIVGEISSNDQHLIQCEIAYNFTTALTPLHIIALHCDNAWLSYIFDQFAPLLENVFLENFNECLQFIITNDIDQLNSALKTDSSLTAAEDVAGWTLLNWATCLNKPDCLDILLRVGADINQGRIPSPYLACAQGNLEILKQLVLLSKVQPATSSAAVKELKDAMNNNTCLHFAAFYGHSSCLEYLIENFGEDITVLNDNDETPLDLAQLITEDTTILQRTNCFECVQLLMKHEAQPLKIRTFF